MLLACAVGLGLTGLMFSQRAASFLPTSVCYLGACLAFVGALTCVFASGNKGD